MMRLVNSAILALVIVLIGSGCGPENSEAKILQHANSILDRLSQDIPELPKHQAATFSKGIKQNKEKIIDAVSKFVAACDQSDLPVVEEIAEFMDVFSSEVLTVASEVSKDKSKKLVGLALHHRARMQKLLFKTKNFKPGTLNAFSELLENPVGIVLSGLGMGSLSDMKQFTGNFTAEKNASHPHDEHEEEDGHAHHGHNHGHSHGHADDDHEHGPDCEHGHHH